MVPGPGGTLYVLIPGSGASVLARLDGSGEPAPGWPIRLPAPSYCGWLLPADDGSVRVVCYAGDHIAGVVPPVWAFAFDPGGRPLPGWPVELPCCFDGGFVGRVSGDTLTFHERQYRGDSVDSWVVSVAADGTVRIGERVTYANCCGQEWAIGPDGIAYRIVLHFDATGAETTSELVAVGPAGLLADFPVVIRGIASKPVFDAAGRIHVTVATVTVASPYRGPARTLVFDADGRAVAGGSGDLGFVATNEYVGIELAVIGDSRDLGFVRTVACSRIEGSCALPAAPLVGADGTTFVIGAYLDSTTAAAVSPSGEIMAGWPYRSDAGNRSWAVCEGDVCDYGSRVAPAIGPDHTLYLLHSAASPSVGESIVAVGPDGHVRPGWPVGLKRAGAEFWSVVVAPNGTAYALAIEPEAGNTSSASILAMAPDSTVLWTTTIIEP